MPLADANGKTKWNQLSHRDAYGGTCFPHALFIIEALVWEDKLLIYQLIPLGMPTAELGTNSPTVKYAPSSHFI